MAEKKDRGRFTLRFNEGDPIHEAAIGLLELQSPRTKAQYVANAVVYYNEHFSQEPQPLQVPSITKEAVEEIVKQILSQEGVESGKSEVSPAAAPAVDPVPFESIPMAQEISDSPEMDDRTRSLIASTLTAFRSRR